MVTEIDTLGLKSLSHLRYSRRAGVRGLSTGALLVGLGLVTASNAIAQDRVPKGAATERQLAQLYKRYADAKDREGIRRLVYWPTVPQRERGVFDRSLEHDLTFEVQSVTVGPIPKMILAYTRDGVTYRPTLKPIGALAITYVPRGNVKGFSTQYLIGRNAGRYYITLASPTEK